MTTNENAIAVREKPAATLTKGGAGSFEFEGLWRMADAMSKSGLAPKDYSTTEKCFAAMAFAVELGLPPMTGIRNIAVINGKASLYGDGVVGLVRASGQLEDINERYEGTPGKDDWTAICIVKRKDQASPCERRFSVAQARRAGLWEKPGPWKQFPERMLMWRAKSWALRDTFADVLQGMSVYEEEIGNEPVREQPQRISAGAGSFQSFGQPAPATETDTNAQVIDAEYEERRPTLEEENEAVQGMPDDGGFMTPPPEPEPEPPVNKQRGRKPAPAPTQVKPREEALEEAAFELCKARDISEVAAKAELDKVSFEKFRCMKRKLDDAQASELLRMVIDGEI